MQSFIRQVFSAFLFMLSLSALAQESSNFPSRPITWLIGAAPGGGSDIFARTVAQAMSSNMGQPVLVVNKPGASSIIAAEQLKMAPKDGYTILTADNGTLVFNAALFKKLPYNVKTDFDYVTLMMRVPLLLVSNPSFPARDYRSFVELVRSQPGKFNYASPGIGIPHNLAVQFILEREKLDVQAVQYKGGGPAAQDVIAGQVPFMVLDSIAARPFIRGGQLRAIVSLSEKRLPEFADVPAISEYGVTDVELSAWQGMVVPRGTPSPIIERLQAEYKKAINEPSVQRRLREMGVETLSSSSKEFQTLVDREIAQWHPLIASRGIKAD